MLTIDASAWVNADSPLEPGHAESRALLDLVFARPWPVTVPTLLPIEVSGVIARTRGDAILAEDMATAMMALPTIRWVALDEPLCRRAVELAARHRLRGADSVYAAVALVHRCELISLDNEHLTRLPPVVPTSRPADAHLRLQTIPPS